MARILVVDDEPHIREVVRAYLARDGHVVLTAADGEEALAIAHRDGPDLIVLDVMLPKRSGFEVLRELRAGGSTAAVVMLTARDEVIDRVAGLETGADDYVTKPFEPRELVARVSAVLRRTGNERPPAPPSTSSEQMRQELAEVKQTVRDLTREQLAIAYFWADGAATYTPPGHWNDVATEYVRDGHFSEVRAARAFALLNMAMHDAAVGCWDAKFAYFNPRPSQLDPGIKTMLGLPNFPSYTSGHSTFSAAAAVVLSYLFPSGSASFESMRDEAAISRLYGAIHYRADIDEGKAHGARIGGYTVAFAHQDGAD